jgi:hypothetical protein
MTKASFLFCCACSGIHSDPKHKTNVTAAAIRIFDAIHVSLFLADWK